MSGATGGGLSAAEKRAAAARLLEERIARARSAPLSFAQRRLWFLQQMEPESAAYHLTAAWRIEGALDTAALGRALAALVRRHESLRTAFPAADGDPVQRIAPAPASFPLPVADLSALPETEREDALRARLADEAARPFDLASGPLFRVLLARVGEGDHALLLTMHHAVSDGWSLGVLKADLSALYAAEVSGVAAALPPLPVRYADYALWQRDRMAGEMDAQAAWWRQRLAGAPALLELPTDHPRPAVGGSAGAVERFDLPPAVAARLRALAGREGATLFMVLLAAWKALLARYAGQDAVVVGTPVAGRGRPELEGVIGFFANTLALRTDLGGDPTFRALLARVREGVLEAQARAEVPLDRVIEELKVERTLAHAPVFQAMFSLQNAPRAALHLPGADARPLRVDAAAAQLDLTLTLAERDGGLTGTLEYRTDLFEPGTVRRHLAHFGALLASIAEDADRRPSEIDLLDDVERRRVLVDWNGAPSAVPTLRLHELLEARARENPDAEAILFGDGRTTYGQLNARANRLARRLRGMGVGAETRVGVLMERTPDLIAALFAVLKAGGAYLPLDPAYPSDRLAFMLADAAAPVVLTETPLLGRVVGGTARVLVLDEAWGGMEGENGSDLEPVGDGGSLAYVIYTSGSTGRPKGVAIEHRSASAFVHWVRDAFPAEDRASVLASTSVCFDVSVAEIFGTLCWGGRIVLVDNALALASLPASTDVRTAAMVPSAAAELARAGSLPASLRVLDLAGEALPPPLARALYERFPALDRVANLYGPTEATVYATWTAVERGAPRVAIGRPLACARAYVLDAALRPAPVGVPGELYLGGAGVARGYLGRPALTAEKFVPDPFSADAGARMYRTGDRARWLPTGEIEYLGRLDGQVKVRGFRVEPGEIEAALLEHPGVREAVVVVRRAAAGDARLAAYVAADADEGSLRAHLGGRLPGYMVPSALVFLPSLPQAPNGKIDRAALPEPEWSSVEGERAAPSTPAEEVLAGIWAEVLAVDEVGARDDFFALGGHSLLAARVAARVRQAFRVELPLRALFEHRTVEALARAVEAARRTGGETLPAIARAWDGGALPLSPAQQRLWFLQRMEPESGVYNVYSVHRLEGALGAGALARALAALVRRHEALRTTFPETPAGPVQRILPPPEAFDLPVEDLSAADALARGELLRRWALREAYAPFDPAAAPPFRARLARLGADEHVLLMAMHHLVSDGWSMAVIRRDLSALYAAEVEGGDAALPALPALPVRYADFTLWQREHLAGDAVGRQVEYWRDRLSGAPALLELPTDRPRPAVAGSAGAERPLAFSAALAEGVRALARREGATPFMVLLAAWQALLARYAGTDDVSVGTPVAGRAHREVEGVVGSFVNTVVVRTDLSGDPPFRELLGRVREGVLDAHAHQDVPFERLVEELRLERSTARTPLFQAMLAMQSTPRAPLELPGIDARPVRVGSVTAKFDLTLTVAERPEGLAGALEYRADLFDAATADRMIAHLGVLLEGIVADPSRRLSEIPLLDEVERRRVVDEWNPRRIYDSARTLHDWFAARAARTPESIAVTFEDASLTYAELDARSNRIARVLRRRGVGPESRVGICLDRGLELVAAILGVLKSGGAYVPIDPAYPADRIAYTLGDSGACVLVTTSDLVARLPEHGAQILALDTDAAAIEAESSEAMESGAGPENAAYVIYTSGSTGRPKGVVVEHRQVVRLMTSTEAWYGFDAEDVWTLFHSASFDFSVWEIWGALLYGGRLVVVPYLVSRSPEQFRALLAREGVTVLNQTPSAFRALIRADEEAHASGDADPLALRFTIFGGEALDPATLRGWIERHGEDRPRFVNMYGITETTVHVTYRPLGANDLGRGSVIGGAIQDLAVYVLDAGMRPCPIGVPGELYVGGAGLARGYLGRPSLTAQRFVPDPFAGDAGARLYRSGDRARWLESGELEYLGRLDEQVKIRGFRIELGEIESALLSHPQVREATVLVRDDAAGEKSLAAYLVPRGEAPPATALRAHLRERLPEFMVPAAFVAMDRLPLTTNGKLDRRALPAPETARAEDDGEVPRTPTEEVLAGIWAELLGRERVGVDESFFDLGGHSLLATRLVARVRAVFRVDLPLRALFDHHTLGALASAVDAALGRGERTPLPPISAASSDGDAPLSFGQRRLWFLQRMDAASAAYNVPAAWRLSGALDADALERAMAALVERHHSLRTVFPEVDGEPVQRVLAAPAGFALERIDLSHLPEGDRDEALRTRIAAESSRPFDLAAGPLFRALLLRIGDAEHALLTVMHHTISDGWSTGVLLRELSALYAAEAAGADAALPAPAVQYADFARWQHQHLRGEALERQVAHWRARLAGAPALLELPTDRPRPAVQGTGGASVPFAPGAELEERLRAVARAEGATLFMVLMAAWQALLGRYAGMDDVSVGTPVAGRGDRELDGVIGFFVNTLVVRTDLSGNPTFRELLGRVRDGVLDAHAHQDVPFERLVDELKVERTFAHAPLFQAMLALQNAPRATLDLPDVDATPLRAGSGMAKFDLTLALAERPEGVGGVLEYRTDLFDAATIRRMLEHFRNFLVAAVADPGRRLSEIPLLDSAERRRVVDEWNPRRRYDSARTLHGWFAAQAARTPERIAVTFEDASLTYAELEARANRIARVLRQRGVGPESRVGICLDRGLDLVAAILGVLKAGGAYVPIDPAYPADRIAYTLGDSGARVLVTTSDLVARLPEHSAQILAIDTDAGAIEAESSEAMESGAGPENAAYVIYTSGSTGRPKGVVVEHRQVVRLMTSTEEWYGFDSDDVWTLFHSASFDFSVWEIWGALLYGGRLVVVPYLVSRSPEQFRDLLAREKVTVLNQTPSAFRALIRADEEAHAQNDADPLALRFTIFGGEALDPGTLRGWIDRYGEDRPRFVNMYGITETTVHVTYRPLGANDLGRGSVIGGAIQDLAVYVLDHDMRPCPIGVPGELYVGGAGLARGYLGRPSLTAQRFVPDPFAGDAGARLYRSGDRARWLESGELEYLGRLDEQVKIRGFRIELGEIESALLSHPQVREAAVLVRDDASGEKSLAAYLVPRGDAPASTVLRAHLRDRLPEFMVPAAFVAMDRLPLTTNGKLDRRALPAPEAARAEDEGEVPRTATEEVLAGIWAELLGRERVGMRDSFFDLGGHSLLVVRLAARVRAAFRVELPVRAFFEHATVAELAAAVDAARAGGVEAALPPLVALPRDGGGLPLSIAQERLWMRQQVEGGAEANTISIARALRGTLDVAALARALGAAAARHETLRTAFPVEGGRPVQRIHPAPTSIDIPTTDLRAAEGGRDAALQAWIAAGSDAPFDLAAGPLWRAALARTAEDEHVLLLAIHHLVGDGWSLGVLFRDLTALYAADVRGEAAALPPLPAQFADYAAWERARLADPAATDRPAAHWRARLRGVHRALPALADHPERLGSAEGTAVEPVTLSAETSAALRALARAEAATPFMAHLAAFGALVHAAGGGERFVVATDMAGRALPETQAMVGFFAGMWPQRMEMEGDPTFRQLLRRTRERILEDAAHQHLPSDAVRDALRADRDGGEAGDGLRRLGELDFAFWPEAASSLRLPGVETAPVEVRRALSQGGLSLALTDRAAGAGGELSANPAAFRPATLHRLARGWEAVATAVARDPDVRLSALAGLLAAEDARRRAGEEEGAAHAASSRLRRALAGRRAG